MKLNYKIIWVEDKIESRPFENIKNNIESFIKDKFFNVEIYTAEDFEEFKEKFNSNLSYDLVITDYSLNDSHGNQVIDFIRMDKNILTEVFFYSANRELRTVSLANNSRISFYQLEGTGYHAELQRKIQELISLTIAKFEHIVSMRGMIMHETSSLDLQIDTIVKNQIKNPYLQDALKPALESIFESMIINAGEKFKKAESKNLKVILRDTVLFNSSQKIYALGAILDILGENNFANDYSNEIILIRNQFAHVELKYDESGKEYFKLKDEEVYFNAHFCKEIRKNITKHKKNLDDLELKLQ